MIQQECPDKREVGLAWDRYTTPEEREQRDRVAAAIHAQSLLYKSDWAPKGWNRVHLRQEKLQKQAVRLEHCGDQYSIVGCLGCATRIVGPRRCEVRICAHCSKKYARRIRQRFNEIAEAFPNTAYLRWSHLVLTLRTTPEEPLSHSRAKHLNKCGRKLINKLWPKKEGAGALAVIEVGNNHNLHLHSLVYGRYVPQGVISNLWLKITKDSRIVHISAVRKKKQGINYLLKYITKPPKSDDPVGQALYLDVILGLRRIHTYGILYNCKISKKESTPCPLCSGKLTYCGFHPGPFLTINSKFWEECSIQKNGTQN